MGIRSFDNTHQETISFQTPLTLIVGHNGSGKTTIIECLRYATTGDLPPNSGKNGAFIHDPKLCGEKEVMAQVKLSFKASTGARMVVARSMQLTTQKTKRTQKTLDCHLLVIRNGERTAISSRVAELDQMMPQYLGVSKAVLDSVIFCHQDDSLWPMSEPSVLKKKFDEIFEALKYTKAIDNIKVLRKKQNEELGKLKVEENQYKVDKDRGERAERKATQLTEELDLIRQEIEALTEQIEQKQIESAELFNHSRDFERVIAELEATKLKISHTEETVEKLRSRTDEMVESDEWLQSSLDQYDERVTKMQQEIEAQSMSYREIGESIQSTRQNLGTRMSEEGKLVAEKENFDRQVEQREKLVREIAAHHKFVGYAQGLDDDLVQQFITQLSNHAADKAAALEKTKHANRDELRAAQQMINEIDNQISTLNSAKENAKREINGLDEKTTSIQSQTDKIAADEGGKSVLESAVRDIETCLDKDNQDFAQASWESKISSTEADIRREEDAVERFQGQLAESTARAKELANLEYLRKSHKETRERLETMQGAHGERIQTVIGSKWTPATLEGLFASFSDRHKSKLMDAEQRRSGTVREYEQVEFKLNGSKQNLKRKSEELATSEKQIKQATGADPAEYEEGLAQTEAERDMRKSDVTSYEHLKDYYLGCLEVAEGKNKCKMCRRDFSKESKKEKEEFEKFKDRLRKMASRDDVEVQRELEALEDSLSMYRSVRTAHDMSKRLKGSDIPGLESEVQKYDSELRELRSRLDEQDDGLGLLQSTKKEIDSIDKNVQTIITLANDLARFDEQTAEQSSQVRAGGSTQTLEDIQTSIQESMVKVRTYRKTLSKLASDKSRATSSISSFELELRDAKAKLAQASYQLREKTNLLERIDELRTAVKNQRAVIQSSDERIRELTPQSRQASSRRDDIQQRGNANEETLQEEKSRLTDSLYKIRLASRDIQAYQDKSGPQQLSNCKTTINTLRTSITSLEGQQTSLNREISKLQDHTTRTAETKRQIQDNIDLRASQSSLSVLRSKAAELRAQNAERERERFTRDANTLERSIQRLSADRASKSGGAKSKDDELQRLISEWETDYKDSAHKYKEAHIKVETTKAAIDDLGRYGTALDKAIMRYHALKMEEINRIADELWRRTYQGTDVDSILIRSDAEQANKNRTYNYRVVMVKQDVEMDMRGRCSAGQKVLASIIIRLALAECFGTNCGLIALDEPTTNLDQENIRALANALHDIIMARRAQSNFQLIVITHDEEFLRHMRCGEFVDDYYRVSRDGREKSVIGKLNIGEVM
ncbi:MAG: DNA repair protein rad50 [Vezdaea aestivalis]|nr:MAG: DNA repair protein rad50 [Vezdaea aestivalis]